MTKYEIHKSLARNVLSADVKSRDVLLFMVLLHIHNIYLRPGVVLEDVPMTDATKPLLLPAITRRHAAEVVASLWPVSDERGLQGYWYALFNKRTPFEVLNDVPAEDLARLMELKKLLLSESRVEAVVED